MNIEETQELCANYPTAERDAVAAALTRVALGCTNEGGVPPALVAVILLALAIDVWHQAHGEKDLVEVFDAFIDHSLSQYEEEGDTDEC